MRPVARCHQDTRTRRTGALIVKSTASAHALAACSCSGELLSGAGDCDFDRRRFSCLPRARSTRNESNLRNCCTRGLGKVRGDGGGRLHRPQSLQRRSRLARASSEIEVDLRQKKCNDQGKHRQNLTTSVVFQFTASCQPVLQTTFKCCGIWDSCH